MNHSIVKLNLPDGDLLLHSSAHNLTVACLCGFVMRGTFAGPHGRIFGIRRIRNRFRFYLGDTVLSTRDVVIDGMQDVSFESSLSNKELGSLINFLMSVEGASREMLGLTSFRL